MPIINVLTPASGLDIFLRNSAGVLTDPASISYDIKEPAGSLVADDEAPFKRSIGHYDARTTTIPSGFSTSLPWHVTWTWISAGGVTSSKTEEFAVSPELTGVLDLDDLIEQIKVDVSVGSLTDEDIATFVVKALDRLNLKLQLTGTDAELSFDEGTGTVQPTPSSPMKALIVMQAECLIVKRNQSDAVRKGIRVKDGRSEIDTTAGFGGHTQLVRSVCDELADAIAAFLRSAGGAEENGGLVWHGNKRIFEDADHDGQAFRVRDFRSPMEDNLGHFDNFRCEP